MGQLKLWWMCVLLRNVPLRPGCCYRKHYKEICKLVHHKPLKHVNCHDANFVALLALGVVMTTAPGAASGDKVVIMSHVFSEPFILHKLMAKMHNVGHVSCVELILSLPPAPVLKRSDRTRNYIKRNNYKDGTKTIFWTRKQFDILPSRASDSLPIINNLK